MEEQEAFSERVPETPEIYPDLAPVWEAFEFLSPSRPQGMSLGAIPLTEIVAYWKEIGGVLNQADLNEKVRLVRRLDDVYLAIMREKS